MLRRRLVPACGLLLIGTVAGCGSSPSSAPSASGGSGYTSSMQAALKAADRIAVDLTTFDYRKLDAFYAQLKSVGTSSFAQDLQTTRADTVAFDQRLKVVSQGEVIASAAQPAAADGTVTVLLFVDQRLRSNGAKVGQLEEQRVQMVMKSVGGTWLADKVTVSGSS